MTLPKQAYVGVSAVAAYLSVSDQTVRNWIAQGAFPGAVQHQRAHYADARAVGYYVNPLQGRASEVTQEQLNAMVNDPNWVVRIHGYSGMLNAAKYSAYAEKVMGSTGKRLCGICELTWSRFQTLDDDRCEECANILEHPRYWPRRRKQLAKECRQRWWVRFLGWLARL